MENLLRKREPQKKPLPWFSAMALGLIAAGACSFLTPHPYELLRVCRAGLAPAEAVPTELPSEAPAELQQQAPLTAEDKAAQLLEQPSPWCPQSSFRMSGVRLPNFPPALLENVGPQYEPHIQSLLTNAETVFTPGTTASQDRNLKEAYSVSVSIDVLLPKAAGGHELLAANPALSSVFPRYAELMQAATVSPWYHALYLRKQTLVRKAAAMVEPPPDSASFYDTDTLLELTAPECGRRLLWLQAGMKAAAAAPAEEREIPLRDELDPFILLPATVQDKRSDEKKGGADFRPLPGDFAAVVVGKRVFPAIVGGFVPRVETGEASVRLCRTVREKADADGSATSGLGVSYLVFPGTAEGGAGVDYARLNVRVRELLAEIGGLGADVEFVELQEVIALPEASGER